MSIRNDRLRELMGLSNLAKELFDCQEEREALRRQCNELLGFRPIVEAAKEVARVARTAPPGFDDDGDPETLWQTSALQDAVEKLVKAVEGKP